MPYAYAAGDYYEAGDNYSRGDFLGIGKAIKKFQPGRLLGGIARKVIGSVPIVGGVAAGLIPGIGVQRPMIIAPHGAPEPGITGIVHRAIPGGSSGRGHYNKQGEFVEGRRPRMNVLNPRALRRAARRAKGFLRFANSLGALPLNRGKGKKLFKRKRG